MFDIVNDFEQQVADYFGAPYAVATDCCTHAIELCLRYTKSDHIKVPRHTYLSIPMTAHKLNLRYTWADEPWQEYYYLNEKTIDAATMFRKNSYIPGTYMCISFQFRKHLSLGRGGMILLDSKADKDTLVKMSYDGRHRDAPWPDQPINTLGYHYYMTPETAQLGLDKLNDAIKTQPKIWSNLDYPDISKNPVFQWE